MIDNKSYFVHNQLAYNLLTRAAELGLRLTDYAFSEIQTGRKHQRSAPLRWVNDGLRHLGDDIGLARYAQVTRDAAPIGHQPTDWFVGMLRMLQDRPESDFIMGSGTQAPRNHRYYSEACHFADPYFVCALTHPTRRDKIVYVRDYPFLKKGGHGDPTMLNLVDIPVGSDGHVLPTGCIFQEAPGRDKRLVVIRPSAFCIEKPDDALSIYGEGLADTGWREYLRLDVEAAFERFSELKADALDGKVVKLTSPTKILT
jgi:hypothetical protein